MLLKVFGKYITPTVFPLFAGGSVGDTFNDPYLVVLQILALLLGTSVCSDLGDLCPPFISFYRILQKNYLPNLIG